MTRYKRFGDLVSLKPPPVTVKEVSVRELSRDTSAVLARVVAGGRAVITKHGAPVAVLMEVDEAVGLCGTKLLCRREAERRLFGEELDARLRSRLMARVPRLLSAE